MHMQTREYASDDNDMNDLSRAVKSMPCMCSAEGGGGGAQSIYRRARNKVRQKRCKREWARARETERETKIKRVKESERNK